MTDSPTPAPYHETFIVVMSNGRTATRSTKSMAYTHALEVRLHDGEVLITSWHQSATAAARKLRDAEHGTGFISTPHGYRPATDVHTARLHEVSSAPYTSMTANTARTTEKNEKNEKKHKANAS